MYIKSIIKKRSYKQPTTFKRRNTYKRRNTSTSKTPNKLTTFIKWSGNKSRYIKHIMPLIPIFTGTYYEPFLGSGAVFLALRPLKWVVNDLNTELINVWLNLKNNPLDIIKFFKANGSIMAKTELKKKFCQKLIDKLNREVDPVKRAHIYLFVKFCVFMGHLLKKNNLYYFYGLELNVNSNKYSFLTDRYFDNILNVSKYLNNSNGSIFNKSYEEILKMCKSGDFVFLDPPYIESDINYKFKYNESEIKNISEIKELLINLKKLNKGVKWLMTQADTPEIRNIFKEFTVTSFEVYRIKAKLFKNELLIRNF